MHQRGRNIVKGIGLWDDYKNKWHIRKGFVEDYGLCMRRMALSTMWIFLELYNLVRKGETASLPLGFSMGQCACTFGLGYAAFWSLAIHKGS